MGIKAGKLLPNKLRGLRKKGTNKLKEHMKTKLSLVCYQYRFFIIVVILFLTIRLSSRVISNN